MGKWTYLSYPLNSEAFGYGNGDRFKLEFVRDMCCGDTSNNSVFNMPTHYGTHIDYPFHFSSEGKKSTEYSAEDFIFKSIAVVEVPTLLSDDLLIRNQDLKLEGFSDKTDLLIIKTGFCNKRSEDVYREHGFGFHPETAEFIKDKFPLIKAIAFDLISLNSYQHREVGREAHKAFLVENDILIIEEVDLRNITSLSAINTVVVAPLQLDAADGAPVTIMAELE